MYRIVVKMFNDRGKLTCHLICRYGELVLAISATATKGLSAENLASLQRHLRFLEVTVPTVEKHGGGGVIN